MPEVWVPWAVRVPGEFANYGAGRIANLTTGLAHFTVGRNSVGLCGKYFQLLGARDGTLYQGAPIDAVCWGAGDPWNGCSVHYEIEYMPGVDDAVFTDACRETTRRTVHWLHDVAGIPLDYYRGPRIASHHGWIAHDSVIQTGEMHSDFWPAEDAALIFGDDDMPLSFEDLVNIGNTIDSVNGTDLAGKKVNNLYLLGELIEVKKQIAGITSAGGAPVALLPSDLDAIATKVADKLAARLKD